MARRKYFKDINNKRLQKTRNFYNFTERIITRVKDRKIFLDEYIAKVNSREDSPHYIGPKYSYEDKRSKALENYNTRINSSKAAAIRMIEDLRDYDVFTDEQEALLKSSISLFSIASGETSKFWNVYTYYYDDYNGWGEMRGVNDVTFSSKSKDRKILKEMFELQLGKDYVKENLGFL